MSLSIDELNAFHRFAETLLASRETDCLQELVDIWEIEHLSPEVLDQNRSAVRAALRDMASGDSGRPAKLVVNELRSEFATRSEQ
jgi:hypothetical protein